MQPNPAPAAQEELEDQLDLNGTAPAAQTPGAGAPSSPAAGQDNTLRNRLAREGRERAAERRRADQAIAAAREAAQRNQVLEARLSEVESALTQRQQEDLEAQLAELPPEQRAEWRVQMLQQRVDEMENERATERARADNARRAQADAQDLVRQANEYFKLDGGGLQIRGDEPELDRSTRATYLASLRALGMSREKYGAGGDARGEEPMAARKKAASVLDTLSPEQQEAVRAEIQQEQLRATGAGRSFNPRPVSGGEEVNEDDYIAASMKHKPNKPQDTRAAMSRLAERG